MVIECDSRPRGREFEFRNVNYDINLLKSVTINEKEPGDGPLKSTDCDVWGLIVRLCPCTRLRSG